MEHLDGVFGQKSAWVDILKSQVLGETHRFGSGCFDLKPFALGTCCKPDILIRLRFDMSKGQPFIHRCQEDPRRSTVARFGTRAHLRPSELLVMRQCFSGADQTI